MNDILANVQSLLDWRFFLIFSGITLAGSLVPLRYLKPFRSVRFNIWLFAVIAAASALGTFIPQNKPAEQALGKLGAGVGWLFGLVGQNTLFRESVEPRLWDVFQKMGLLDIYHSWWFAAMLGLMAFDVIACKLRTLPFNLTERINGELKPTGQIIAEIKRKSSLKEVVGLKSRGAVDGVRGWFKKTGLKFREISDEQGTVVFVGVRQGIQKWGDFILHVSIVAILTGNLIGAIFGFEEQVPVAEGDTYKMKNRPWDVTLTNFEIEYYRSTGAPSLYASDIVVTEDGKVVGQDRIIVNEPLDINTTRFYQATWGMTTAFRSVTLLIAGQELRLKPGEVVKVPKTPFSVRANAFLPTFDVDEHGHATTTDYSGGNPAVQIDFLQKGQLQVSVWILRNDPHVAFKADREILTRTAPPPFQLVDVDPILFSGIQVGFDPGASIFWTAACILLIGMCLHFYFHLRYFTVIIDPAAKSVFVGGWNSRTPEDYKVEFSRLAASLQKQI